MSSFVNLYFFALSRTLKWKAAWVCTDNEYIRVVYLFFLQYAKKMKRKKTWSVEASLLKNGSNKFYIFWWKLGLIIKIYNLGWLQYSSLWNCISEIRNDRYYRINSFLGHSAGLITALNIAVLSTVTEKLLLSSAGAR